MKNKKIEKEEYISKRIYSGFEKDYNKFVTCEGNRGIRPGQVMKLHDSMRVHHNISSISCFKSHKYPDKYVIFDGQHRFEASKQLKQPVEFSVWDVNEEAMIALNENQVNWKLEDYLNYNVSIGKEDYIVLDHYRKSTGMAITALIELFSYEDSSATYYKSRSEVFKSGLWRIKDKEKSEELLGYLLDFYNRFGIKHSTHLKFILAFKDIFNSPQYNHDRMVDQISKCSQMLTKQANRIDYVKCFELVYNYNKKSDLVQFPKHRKERDLI